MMLCLVSLYQRRQYIQVITMPDSGQWIIHHQGGNLVKCRIIVGLGSDRLNIHGDYFQFTVLGLPQADGGLALQHGRRTSARIGQMNKCPVSRLRTIERPVQGGSSPLAWSAPATASDPCRHWGFAGLGPQSSGQRTLAMAMS